MHLSSIDEIITMAQPIIGSWVALEKHSWCSLYAWKSAPIYDSYGDISGNLKANTIYLCETTPCPEEDLLHELGHVVARKFNLIGTRDNGFLGRWEARQKRMVGSVQHFRHWSRFLNRIRLNHGGYTPELCSEIWAELFMCWHLYPQRRELTYIEDEMRALAHYSELVDIERLVTALTNIKRRQ